MQRILEGNIYLQFLLLINFSKMTLKERILRHKRGKIFFIDYFPDYKDEYVKKILFELEKEGILIRLAPGMYYLPIQSRLGVLYPSVDEIVQAIAKRDHATIMPSANTALHQLGFTPQVPMNYEYLTNGAARIVHLEHNTVRLKHGVASNFAYRGKLMPLLHQALQAIGKVNIKDGCATLRRLWGPKRFILLLVEAYARQRGFNPEDCVAVTMKERVRFWTHYQKKREMEFKLEL